MKKFTLTAALILFAGSLLMAENLIKNGTFEQLAAGKPAAWKIPAGNALTFADSGAPAGGLAKFVLAKKDGKEPIVNFSQDVTALVKGGNKYQISYKFRTSGFRGITRVVLAIDGWSRSVGSVVGGRFPKDWKEYKAVVTLPAFKKNAVLIIMAKGSGTAEFADVKVVAVK